MLVGDEDLDGIPGDEAASVMKLRIFGSSDRDITSVEAAGFPSEALVKLVVDWPCCEVDRDILVSASALECS